jgi:hypothetical protein
METDSRLSDLERSLALLIEKGEAPGALAVDLDDLLFTSEQLCALLVEIAQEGSNWSPAELKSKLFKVQIMIEQDLPLIFDDLLPPLQKLSGEVLGRIPPGRK